MELNKLVDYIFAKFALLCRGYDSLYADQRRLDAEKNQWASTFAKQGIVGFNQVKRGLEKLELWTMPLPPQLGEFMSWCKDEREFFDKKYPMYDSKMLEQQRAQPSTVKTHMQKIMEMLK